MTQWTVAHQPPLSMGFPRQERNLPDLGIKLLSPALAGGTLNHRGALNLLTFKWLWIFTVLLGFPCGSAVKESSCSTGDVGLIPGLERSPWGGNGYPLQYPCLENPMKRRGWWARVHGVAKSRTFCDWATEHACTCSCYSFPNCFGFVYHESFSFLVFPT